MVATMPKAMLMTVNCPQCGKLLARNLRGSIIIYCRRCKVELEWRPDTNGQLVVSVLTA